MISLIGKCTINSFQFEKSLVMHALTVRHNDYIVSNHVDILTDNIPHKSIFAMSGWLIAKKIDICRFFGMVLNTSHGKVIKDRWCSKWLLLIKCHLLINFSNNNPFFDLWFCLSYHVYFRIFAYQTNTFTNHNEMCVHFVFYGISVSTSTHAHLIFRFIFVDLLLSIWLIGVSKNIFARDLNVNWMAPWARYQQIWCACLGGTSKINVRATHDTASTFSLYHVSNLKMQYNCFPSRH